MSLYETLFIGFSNCLGVKLFKKIWSTKGSFDQKKLNKNSIDDLNNVINDANDFTKIHISGVQNYISVFIPMNLGLCFLDKKLCLPITILTIPLLIHEVYPLIVHEYNRILARRRIKYLMKNNIDESIKLITFKLDNDITNFNNINKLIQIQKIWNVYKLFINNFQINLSFASFETIYSFTEFLQNKFNNNILFEQIIEYDNCKKTDVLYQEFISFTLNK
jgi:hypothetical protein